MWLTEESAAEYMAVSPSTLVSWRSRRTGPRYIKKGRLIRYKTQWIDEWLEASVINL